MRIYDARHMVGTCDEYQLTILHDNDPTWFFRLRDQQFDGTLVNVDEGDVRFVVRKIGHSIEDAESFPGEYMSDGIWKFELPRTAFVGKTPFQVDLLKESRRKTFAAGSVSLA